MRLHKITKLQNQIAKEKALELVGQTIEVLVDSFDSQTGEFLAHSKKMSPLVDFNVRFVDNGNVECYTFVQVKIKDFDGSDYIGEVV